MALLRQGNHETMETTSHSMDALQIAKFMLDGSALQEIQVSAQKYEEMD